MFLGFSYEKDFSSEPEAYLAKFNGAQLNLFGQLWLPYAVRSCKVTFNEILEIRKEDKIAEQRLVKKQVSKQELSVEWKIKGLLHHDAQFPTKTTNRVLTSLKSIGYTFLRHFVFTILWNSPSIVKITLPCHKVFDKFY